MKLLLHCCCGPCTLGSLPQFNEADYQPFCWFFNPNIHPYQEHLARKDAFCQLMEKKSIPFAVVDEYPLEDWLIQVADNPADRCSFCYQNRLEAAAKYAKENGFDAFSSTLLISPYQNHQLIIELGKQMAKEYGLQFIDLDLRPGFRDGLSKARAMGLYMQKYCGCIYSEKERYLSKSKGANNEKQD